MKRVLFLLVFGTIASGVAAYAATARTPVVEAKAER